MTRAEEEYYASIKRISRSLEQDKKIDWEQRRYEIAKDVLASLVSVEENAHIGCKELAERSVVFAGALISELKNNTNNGAQA